MPPITDPIVLIGNLIVAIVDPDDKIADPIVLIGDWDDAKAGILSAEVGAYANADSVAGTLDLSDYFAER
jgi:hypothetical protein